LSFLLLGSNLNIDVVRVPKFLLFCLAQLAESSNFGPFDRIEGFEDALTKCLLVLPESNVENIEVPSRKSPNPLEAVRAELLAG
jgi:hypothetical protein